MVTDFDSLGEELRRKDKGGTRLYYEDSVQAYFDDEEPFRRIKAMCRLSCRKCEECAPPPPDEPLPKGAVKKGHIFKSIESLRRHLFQSHKLIMCELCLQGRKVGPCLNALCCPVRLLSLPCPSSSCFIFFPSRASP